MVNAMPSQIDDSAHALAEHHVPAGYKQTEVGVIPEDWDVKSLHEFAVVKTGPFGTLLKASEYSECDGVPLISVGEIREGFIRINDRTPRVPESVTRRLPQYILRTGDIVFGRKGGVERSAIIQQFQDGWFLGSDGMSVRLSQDCHDEYLAFQFRSERVQDWLLQNAIGTTMPSLNQEILRDVVIPLPPTKAEQEAIAEALSDADALIESLEQLIAKKRQIKQGAMQELLTGKKRLPGFSTLGWVTCELGNLPADWRVETIGSIAQVKTGPFGSSLHERDYVDDGIPIITVEHLGETGIMHMKLPMVSEGDRRRLSAYSLEEGDIVFSRVGSVDRNARVTTEESGWLFSGRLLRLRASPSTVDTRYLSYQFHSDPFKQRVRKVAVGQTMASLNTQILNSVLIVLPPLPEQTAIAAILSDMDAEITALEERLAKARMVKQGMMQELLTGRIRLV